MHEHLAAVVTGEKAIPLVGVVPLDLAGRHAQTSCRRDVDNQRSGDRQDAMGTSKAIGPGRRDAGLQGRFRSGLTRMDGAGTGSRARPESGAISPVIQDRIGAIPSTYT